MNEHAETGNGLVGRRVLIVEDEGAIAMLLEDMLLDFGCEIAGTAPRIVKAMTLLDETEIDIAVLDLNVAGETAYPLAEELMRRRIPFIFSTGYGDVGIRKDFVDVGILAKPFTQRELKERLSQAIGEM